MYHIFKYTSQHQNKVRNQVINQLLTNQNKFNGMINSDDPIINKFTNKGGSYFVLYKTIANAYYPFTCILTSGINIVSYIHCLIVLLIHIKTIANAYYPFSCILTSGINIDSYIHCLIVLLIHIKWIGLFVKICFRNILCLTICMKMYIHLDKHIHTRIVSFFLLSLHCFNIKPHLIILLKSFFLQIWNKQKVILTL